MPAGSSLDDTNRVHQPRGEDPARHPGSGKHLAAHRPAARSGRRYRGEHRRFLGQAEARPRPRAIDEVISEVRAKVNEAEPDARCRIPAALAGHDRRSHQLARADRSSSCFRRIPTLLQRMGAEGGRRDQEDRGRGGCDGRHREHHQRAGHRVQVDPVVAARAGFTPQEIELDASAILQGEPATTPVVVNDRAYTIRVRFPEDTRAIAGHHPQHPADQRAPARPRRSGRWPTFRRCRPDRNPAREPAARRRGHRRASKA